MRRPNPLGDAQAAHRAYLAELARVDMRVVDGVRRDPQRVQRVLRSLARNISTEAEITTIAKDTSLPPDGAAVGRLTVDDYLDALARLMITEDLGAWTPSLRSRARLRTRPVRHLADPCLAVAALRASPKALLADWDYTGLLFENMVLRDMRVYLDAIGGTTYHYRDSNGLEVDIIVELDDGRWGAIEVKLGENRIEEGASRWLPRRQPPPSPSSPCSPARTSTRPDAPTESTSSPSPRSARRRPPQSRATTAKLVTCM